MKKCELEKMIAQHRPKILKEIDNDLQDYYVYVTSNQLDEMTRMNVFNDMHNLFTLRDAVTSRNIPDGLYERMLYYVRQCNVGSIVS